MHDDENEAAPFARETTGSRSAIITLRLTHQERRLVHELAQAARLSTNAFLLHLLSQQHFRRELQQRMSGDDQAPR